MECYKLMIVVAIIGILAAVAIPQYQNYIAKSQVSRVMSETGALKTAVETCLLEGVAQADCKFGWTNSNLIGAATTLQTGLDVTFGEDAANTTIVAQFGGNAAQTLQAEGKRTLTWSRTPAGVWTCSTLVEEKYRPTGCSASTPEEAEVIVDDEVVEE